MNVWKYCNGNSRKVNNILELLLEQAGERKSGPLVIAAAGAGGKTSLLWRLAQEARALGIRTVLGTTTHMLLPESASVLDGDAGRAAEILERDGFVCIGTPCPDWKKKEGQDRPLPPGMQGGAVKCQKAPEPLRELLKERAELILEEADGSRRLPSKFPREDEPVLSEDTDILLAVMGLSSLGKTIKDAFQRYELYPGGIQEQEAIRPEHLAEALRSGYVARVPQLHRSVTVIPVLNQADTPALISQAEAILDLAAQEAPYGLITHLLPEECRDR